MLRRRAAPYDDSPPPNLKFMTNSERGRYYRRRRKLYGTYLEQQVTDLRQEIASLTLSRQVQHELALSQRRTPLGAAALIVNEYCLLFNHGTPVRLAVDEQDASTSLVAEATNGQRGFLHAVMTESVRFGEFLGIDLVLAQWERYSLFHAAIEWTMKSLEVIQLAEPRELNADNRYDDGPLVVSIAATLRVRFSRRTIEEVFPHLVGDEELTQLLIGLEVTYPSNNQFHFDQDGKIEWYAVEADYAGALLTAITNPVLVARIMGEAVIVRGHMIGDEDDGRQLAIVNEVEDHEGNTTEANSPELIDDDCWSSNNKYEGVCVVSDDEPVPESSPKRMELAYILDD
ncbi:hypothetical protein DVH05_028432 [Phytophthora capsici]|nr:hypothetical protein DVH05_028432 [Phytophthora capsici]|eukprot:jgi/Phyca11/15618/fgenesh1_pg.PHYCAscaffold_14_\